MFPQFYKKDFHSCASTCRIESKTFAAVAAGWVDLAKTSHFGAKSMVFHEISMIFIEISGFSVFFLGAFWTASNANLGIHVFLHSRDVLTLYRTGGVALQATPPVRLTNNSREHPAP